MGCRPFPGDLPLSWRGRWPPSPPNPRNGNEAGRAGPSHKAKRPRRAEPHYRSAATEKPVLSGSSYCWFLAMQTKEKARHACGGRARLHIDVQFSIDRDRRPHPADTYDVPDYAGRKIEVAPLLRLIREQDAFRPCREPIAETCDLGDRDGDRSWFSDRVRVSLGHVHSTCSGSGLAYAVRAGRRHRDATPESSHGLGLLRPAPRSGAWPRPCRPRRPSVSASGQGHGRRAARPRTGATIGCRSISRDPPLGWRRRLPPSPPKPRTGDEAGGAGSNRTSLPRRGPHTSPLALPPPHPLLATIYSGFHPH